LRDGVEILEEGTTDRAAVYPRRVMDSRLEARRGGVRACHNHSNGNITPSEHDKAPTFTFRPPDAFLYLGFATR